MQDIIDWLKVNPAAFAAVAGLFGGLVAASVAVFTSWMSHYFTAKREAIKTAADERREREKVVRETVSARRAILRAHLERIVTLALQHAETEDRLSKATVLQLTMVATIANHQPDVKALLRGDVSVQPLDEATALARLYFPGMTGPLAQMRGATNKFSEFREQEVKAWLKDKAAWLSALPSIATRDEGARTAMRVAQSNLISQARSMVESELLPAEVNPAPLAVG